MRQQGAYIVDIATQIGCSERTVRRYLKYPEPPARKTRHKMAEMDYIDMRLAENVWNGEVIWRKSKRWVIPVAVPCCFASSGRHRSSASRRNTVCSSGCWTVDMKKRASCWRPIKGSPTGGEMFGDNVLAKYSPNALSVIIWRYAPALSGWLVKQSASHAQLRSTKKWSERLSKNTCSTNWMHHRIH